MDQTGPNTQTQGNNLTPSHPSLAAFANCANCGYSRGDECRKHAPAPQAPPRMLLAHGLPTFTAQPVVESLVSAEFTFQANSKPFTAKVD